MASIAGSPLSSPASDLVSVSVLKMALNAQQSQAAQLVEALQPPAQSSGSSGRQVDLYA